MRLQTAYEMGPKLKGRNQQPFWIAPTRCKTICLHTFCCNLQCRYGTIAHTLSWFFVYTCCARYLRGRAPLSASKPSSFHYHRNSRTQIRHTRTIILFLQFLPLRSVAVVEPSLAALLPRLRQNSRNSRRTLLHVVIARPLRLAPSEPVGKFLQFWLEFLAASTPHTNDGGGVGIASHRVVCIASFVKHHRQETDVQVALDGYREFGAWRRALVRYRRRHLTCGWRV